MKSDARIRFRVDLQLHWEFYVVNRMTTKTPSKPESPTVATAIDAKKKKARSPSYPYLNLEEAVKFAFSLWNKEKRGAAAIPVVATHWGFSQKSSAGLLSVAALKKFGLLIEEGAGERRTVRLSDAALDIIKYEDAPEEQRKFLKLAALKPSIHRELWVHHHDASDATVRRHLIWDLKFTEAAADALIKEYKETVSYAKLESSDKIESADDADEEEVAELDFDSKSTPEPKKPVAQKFAPSAPSSSASQNFAPSAPLADHSIIDIPVPLPSGKLAYYRVPQAMSGTDFEFYKTLLEAYRHGLVKEDAPKPAAPGIPAFPFKALWRSADTDLPVTIVGLMGEFNGETYYRADSGTGIPSSQVDRSVDLDDEEI